VAGQGDQHLHDPGLEELRSSPDDQLPRRWTHVMSGERERRLAGQVYDPRNFIGSHRAFIGESSGRGPVGSGRLSAFLASRSRPVAKPGNQPMTIFKPAMALPLRSRSDVQGPNYSPTPRPAQPSGQSKPERKQPMSRYNRQRLYGVFTAVAFFSLLSPLVVASVTFATVPH
jgi:hypothetical protein